MVSLRASAALSALAVSLALCPAASAQLAASTQEATAPTVPDTTDPSEGEIIEDPKRLKEIARDWAMLDEAMNEHGRDRPTSLSLVLSMPGGSTDPETLQDVHEQVRQRVVALGVEDVVLAVPEN